jgi:predicted NBD/HSP70 family sugar kinase
MTGQRLWHAGIDIGGTQVRLVTDFAGPRCRRVLHAGIPDGYEQLLKLIGELVATATASARNGAAGAAALDETSGAGPVDAAACQDRRLDAAGPDDAAARTAVPSGCAAPAGPAAVPAAVACGLPGTSDGQRPVFVPALAWLEGKPLAADLAEMLGAPVALALDGHLTLLAEVAEGAAVGRSSAVLVAVGTGIGGALMLGGKIWRGHHGSGGAWGWLPRSGRSDDVRHGQFEQAAAGRALDLRAAAVLGGGPPGRLAEPAARKRTGRDLVAAARAGDLAACAAVRDYAAELGRGVAALASTLDPEIVLLGGGLSAVMDLLGPVIEQTMAQAASPDGRRVPVRAAALGPEGGAIGAWHAACGGTEIWL